MSKKISIQNFIFLLLISIIAIFFLFNAQKLVGDHFYYDSLTLKYFLSLPIQENLKLITESSYAATAFIYQFFGIDNNFNNNQQIILNLFIYMFCVFLFLIKKEAQLNNLFNISLLLLVTVFYSVYLGQISKETLVVLMMIIIVTFNGKYNLISILLMLLYGFFVREYWLLIALLFVFNHIILKKNNKILKVILLNFLMITILSFLHILMFGELLTSYRYEVNEYRMYAGEVNTILLNPYNAVNVISDLGNFIYGFTNLILPIDGISSTNELAYYVWILLLTFISIKKLRKANFNDTIVPLSLLISFICVQSIFEPDMGSVLKHQIGLFPLYLKIISLREKEK